MEKERLQLISSVLFFTAAVLILVSGLFGGQLFASIGLFAIFTSLGAVNLALYNQAKNKS
ncbi:putative methyltransferase MtxX (methanogen marker protein 4) [Paenibacillus phyllosphaerae]|uniref:Putative methyltransferase MtxX (Methanogen marker protein 4) n=1 Tax=Paenibacillus phyllosphaerae TaxID=274593 RepID=A0A7W5AU16_9BACL|nr:hypothetical protein [Paenibacillus phyllosphaerae]MBB3108667.1 putative methyltransferase MtxX (methanogen marker protein 4) [Paenibacillus phyllosphaerae]